MKKWRFLPLLMGVQCLLSAQAVISTPLNDRQGKPGTFVERSRNEHPRKSEFRIPNSEIDQDTLLLPEMTLDLSEIVVKAEKKASYTDPSPIKTLVFSSAYLEKRGSPVNLIESIKLVNGLQEVVACGICGTNSISINGLPGAYTAVLIDGMPMYGNLAAVYGLNGISRLLVDRLEVTRGPGQAAYGSEAMAGVINVRTKQAAQLPPLSFDVMATSYCELFAGAIYSHSGKRRSALLGFDAGYFNRFADANADSFGDVALFDRLSLFGKWSGASGKRSTWRLFGKYYYEDRRNGVKDYVDQRAYRRLRGNGAVYGESIYTRRAELLGNWENTGALPYRFDLSMSWHDQDSYYGDASYRATQGIAFVQNTWMYRTGKQYWTGGLSARFQYYDDNTVATAAQAERQWQPGLFVQNEWNFAPRWTALGAGRLDYHAKHGFIVSPRLHLKFKPGEWTTLRLNYGTGFRVVHLFTEDHAFVSGQRELVIDGDLRPERSWTLTANLGHVYEWGKSSGNIDIDLFYTRFANKIIPNYDNPGQIIYANTGGHAMSRGISANVSHRWTFPLSLDLGATLQAVSRTEPGDGGALQQKDVEFAPRWTGLASLNYTWKKPSITLAYTVNATGPMALPTVFDLDAAGEPLPMPRSLTSRPFALHQFQIQKEIESIHLDCYAGVRNIFDYRQPGSPLAGFDDPRHPAGFSPHFDTAYAYAPLQGRVWYVGVRMSH
ncbi:MAG: TonB-dependent receptor [Saprospiraceae bacterium]|nr:TonB-dependent receptor [Saprospiraceae bacterium]